MSKIILTKEQEKIVNHMGTPMRVLAGPGTGKTFCIIEKIKNLINENKVSHKNICVITFTNAASNQIRERLESSGINPDKFPYVNTIHGLAMSILKNHLKRANLKAGFKPIK